MPPPPPPTPTFLLLLTFPYLLLYFPVGKFHVPRAMGVDLYNYRGRGVGVDRTDGNTEHRIKRP